MPKKSAGILLFQKQPLRFFLVHPGGPFWKNKDDGAWSIPKGEFEADELPMSTAIREFREETGIDLSDETNFIELQPVKLKSGKVVFAFALEKNADPDSIISNTFEIEWPPKSGRLLEIPEVDKAAWFEYEEAVAKINSGQIPLLDEVKQLQKG
ncbi:NUDIX domain-containing protein [Flavobacterium silvaticum]|uniref:NUDIX domain-containing protein n=1 Tax=Flavobacterium silvaticum TaxID=1852020 RepID=A0A972JK51_9FLAO|nr:NUDIX domain-containing protein [Flavobacterium silvaticum]NMH28782.1 NUDIX domain-containing protein [Flavobacterium silvaticum]